jgi:hypothetical protein
MRNLAPIIIPLGRVDLILDGVPHSKLLFKESDAAGFYDPSIQDAGNADQAADEKYHRASDDVKGDNRGAMWIIVRLMP